MRRVRIVFIALLAFGPALLFGATSLANSAGPRSPLLGRWQFTEHMEEPLSRMTCDSKGFYEFGQSGKSFDGKYEQTGSCNVLGRILKNNGNGPVEVVHIGRDFVQFKSSYCEYYGPLAANEKSIHGTMRCSVVLSGKTYVLDGSWSATKQ